MLKIYFLTAKYVFTKEYLFKQQNYLLQKPFIYFKLFDYGKMFIYQERSDLLQILIVGMKRTKFKDLILKFEGFTDKLKKKMSSSSSGLLLGRISKTWSKQ